MKKIRIRRNVKGYADMDYIEKLSPEQKAYMDKFVDEYYCNGHGKEGSLHREALGDSYKSHKKELHLNHNAQNRDILSIAGCSNNVVPIQKVEHTLTIDQTESIEKDWASMSPDALMDKLIMECSDEISTQSKEDMAGILKEYGLKVIAQYLLTKKETERQARLNRKAKKTEVIK